MNETSTTKPTAPAHARWYTIPAGSTSRACRGPNCAQRIYFVKSEQTGSIVPVSIDFEGGEAPSETNDASQLDMFAGETMAHDGRGVSHYFDCVDRDLFSKRGGR